MKKLSSIKYILSAYHQSPVSVRLFVLTRYIVCPWENIINHLSGIDSLLDIGCGHGLFLHLAQKQFPALRCTGIDHDENKIQHATMSDKSKEIQFIYSSQMTELKPPKFDCVSIIDVLYSIPKHKWGMVLDFVKTLIKPNGTVIIKETVNAPSWKYRFCLMQEKVAIEWLKYTKGSKPSLPDPQLFIHELYRAGFSVCKSQRIDFGYPWPHYLIIASPQSSQTTS